MSDSDIPKISEPIVESNSVVEVLPPIMQQKPNTVHHVRNEQLAGQIRELGRNGLTATQAARCARISKYVLDKYYLEDFEKGSGEVIKNLAAVAVNEAMNGNTAVLLHLLKTRLGWSEQQVIEHIGEVRAVVSSKPLTREQFEAKYLSKDED